jgi:hypothetical protein
MELDFTWEEIEQTVMELGKMETNLRASRDYYSAQISALNKKRQLAGLMAERIGALRIALEKEMWQTCKVITKVKEARAPREVKEKRTMSLAQFAKEFEQMSKDEQLRVARQLGLIE